MSIQPSRQEILLESGTNEMEIIEFYLGEQPFGINVQKLKEIVPYDPGAVTRIPESPPSILGTLLLRGSSIPLIDLKGHIGHTSSTVAEDSRQVVLVCEFNDRVSGFLVDGVNQIHRISWSQVQPMASYIDQYRPRFTGSVSIDERDILIVDLECIIADVDPDTRLDYDAGLGGTLIDQRGRKRLMLAEDSAIIRDGIKRVLTTAGYTDLDVYDNGADCYAAIQARLAEAAEQQIEPLDALALVISDIEMPAMDGLTLCRKIKQEMKIDGIKVVMFSSLINDQMALKCDAVGADGYCTKPQIPELVDLMDGFLGLSEDKG